MAEHETDPWKKLVEAKETSDQKNDWTGPFVRRPDDDEEARRGLFTIGTDLGKQVAAAFPDKAGMDAAIAAFKTFTASLTANSDAINGMLAALKSTGTLAGSFTLFGAEIAWTISIGKPSTPVVPPQPVTPIDPNKPLPLGG